MTISKERFGFSEKMCFDMSNEVYHRKRIKKCGISKVKDNIGE